MSHDLLLMLLPLLHFAAWRFPDALVHFVWLDGDLEDHCLTLDIWPSGGGASAPQ